MGLIILLSSFIFVQISFSNASSIRNGPLLPFSRPMNPMMNPFGVQMDPSFGGKAFVVQKKIKLLNGVPVGEPKEESHEFDFDGTDDLHKKLNDIHQRFNTFGGSLSRPEERPDQPRIPRRVEIPITDGPRSDDRRNPYKSSTNEPEDNVQPQYAGPEFRRPEIFGKFNPREENRRPKRSSSLTQPISSLSSENDFHKQFQDHFNQMREMMMSGKPMGRLTMFEPQFSEMKPSKSKSPLTFNFGKGFDPLDSNSLGSGLSPFGSKSGSSKPSIVPKDASIAKAALIVHNKYREQHCVEPLEYDDKIAAFAQEYADYLASKDMFDHNPEAIGLYGENLDYKRGSIYHSRTDAEMVESAIDGWYDEIRQYHGSPNDGAGHFTQVVWKGSQRVGVGVARKGEKVYVVANYDPPGNMIGDEHENVLPVCKSAEVETATAD